MTVDRSVVGVVAALSVAYLLVSVFPLLNRARRIDGAKARRTLASMTRAARGIPVGVWWLSGVMFVLGGAAVAAGIMIEARGTWDTMPFTTNVASSFASALFGIPLALILISTVTDATSRHRERVMVQADLQRASQSIYVLARSLAREPDFSRATANIRDLAIDWKKLSLAERGRRWGLVLVEPGEVVAAMRRIATDYAFLDSKRMQALGFGWAWLSHSLVTDMSSAPARAIDALESAPMIFGELLSDPQKDQIAYALERIALVHLQSVHVRNTFLFGEEPVD